MQATGGMEDEGEEEERRRRRTMTTMTTRRRTRRTRRRRRRRERGRPLRFQPVAFRASIAHGRFTPAGWTSDIAYSIRPVIVTSVSCS